MPRKSLRPIVFVALVALASTAQAQSGSAPIWQGAYLGIGAGSHWGKFTQANLDGDANGFAISGYGGYNWQIGNFVFGAEGDINRNTGRFEQRATFVSRRFGFGSTTTEELSAAFVASLRGRVGFTIGSTLIYGTGGVAFAKIEERASISALRLLLPPLTTSATERKEIDTGYVFGGGVEHKFTQTLSGRVEAVRYNFNDLFATTGFDYKTTTVRAGLTYHFN